MVAVVDGQFKQGWILAGYSYGREIRSRKIKKSEVGGAGIAVIARVGACSAAESRWDGRSAKKTKGSSFQFGFKYDFLSVHIYRST